MFKQPYESLIGQCEHSIIQGFLFVWLLWYQKVAFDKSLMLSQILLLGISFILVHQQGMLFWIGIGHTLIDVKREIKLVHEKGLICDHF